MAKSMRKLQRQAEKMVERRRRREAKIQARIEEKKRLMKMAEKPPETGDSEKRTVWDILFRRKKED